MEHPITFLGTIAFVAHHSHVLYSQIQTSVIQIFTYPNPKIMIFIDILLHIKLKRPQLCIQSVLFHLSEHFSYLNTPRFQCVWISDFPLYTFLVLTGSISFKFYRVTHPYSSHSFLCALESRYEPDASVKKEGMY